MRSRSTHAITLALCATLMLAGCGDDGGNAADEVGVGAECATSADCPQQDVDAGYPLVCLTQFGGGYCGLSNCTGDVDCPNGSACVAHGDGTNYCFRLCIDKAECNVNRGSDVEANCNGGGTVDFVDNDDTRTDKVCIPPNSGP